MWKIGLSFFNPIALALVVGLNIAIGGDGTYRPAGSGAALRVPILMYHYISANPRWPADPVRTRLSVPPKQFEGQLAYLRRAGYRTITLDDLTAALQGDTSLPSKPIVLTFDDGYEDFYTNAFPLLQRYDDQATIYIISHMVGLPGYLTWPQLRVLAASPLITIGAHTRTHPVLSALTARRSWDELAGSKGDLESRLGISVRHLAYPYGRYNATTLLQARKIGFETAVTTQAGLTEWPEHMLELPRVRVNGGMPLSDLIAGIAGRRTVGRAPRLNPGLPHSFVRRDEGISAF